MTCRHFPTAVPALAALFASMGFLAACASSEPTPPPPEPQPQVVDPPPAPEPVDPLLVPPDGRVRVALLVPLTGPAQDAGKALLNAAQLALFDQADDNFELLVEDTWGTPEGARAAANRAVDQGAQLLLGPLFGASAPAVAAVASQHGIQAISFSNNRSVAAPSLFVMGVLPDAQVARVVDYASRQGLQRFAVFAPRTAYGELAVAALTETAEKTGAEVTKIVTYDPAGSDVAAQAQVLADYQVRRADLQQRRAELEAVGDEASKAALKRLEILDTLGPPNFDALLLPAGGSQLLSVAPLLPYYDVDASEIQFLGTSQWQDPAAMAEPSIQGGWFAAPPLASWDAFRLRYAGAYGDPNPPRIAALGYDGTALAAVLANRATSGGASVAAVRVFQPQDLTDPDGFAGVDGIFRFGDDGVVQRGLAVLKVSTQGPELLEEAPTDFDQALF